MAIIKSNIIKYVNIQTPKFFGISFLVNNANINIVLGLYPFTRGNAIFVADSLQHDF